MITRHNSNKDVLVNKISNANVKIAKIRTKTHKQIKPYIPTICQLDQSTQHSLETASSQKTITKNEIGLPGNVIKHNKIDKIKFIPKPMEKQNNYNAQDYNEKQKSHSFIISKGTDKAKIIKYIPMADVLTYKGQIITNMQLIGRRLMNKNVFMVSGYY